MKKIIVFMIFTNMFFVACQNNEPYVQKNIILYNKQLKESLDKKDLKKAGIIIKNSPENKNLDYYKYLVKYYYLKGELDRINKINEKEKNKFVKNYVKGLILFAKGIYHFDEALQSFYEAEKYKDSFNGSINELYYNIAVIELKKENFEKAFEYINKTEESMPKYVVLKAYILMKKGKYKESRTVLNNIFSKIKDKKLILKAQKIMDLSFNMNNPMPKKLHEAYTNWLAVAQTGKNLQVVLKVAKEGMTEFPQYSEMFTLAGIASYLLDNKAQAATYFQKALKIDPERPFNYLQMGIIYLNLKQIFKAREYFLKALKINKYLPLAYAYLSKIEKDANNPEKAVNYKKLQLKFGDDYNAWMELAKLYEMTKSPLEVKKLLVTLIKKYPSKKEPYRSMVHLYDRLIDDEPNPKLKLKLRKEQIKYEQLFKEKDEEESKKRLIKAEIEKNGSNK